MNPMRSAQIIGGLALMAMLSALTAPPLFAQVDAKPLNQVRFQTWGEDSLELVGTYYPAPESDLPVVLLLHDRGVPAADLVPLARALGSEGMTVFLPQLRGEGASVVARGRPVTAAGSWTRKQSSLMVRDLAAITHFADRQPTLSGLPWILVAEGESVGVALELLVVDDRFKGAMLLSPSPAGPLDPEHLAAAAPLVLLACDQDEQAVEALRALYGQLPRERRRMELMPCRSRGARMLEWVPGLTTQVVTWALATGGP